MTPAFLNDRSAAAVIGTSRETVRQLRLRGVLAFTNEGRSIQIPRESVDRYIETKRAEAEDDCLRRARMSGVGDPANAPYVDMIFRGHKRRALAK